MGLVLGILTSQDAAILRTMKGIRNDFAHRVRAGFLSPTILKKTTKLFSLWIDQNERLSDMGAVSRFPEDLKNFFQQSLPRYPEAGGGLLLIVFSVYQAYFHQIYPMVKRVGQAIEAAGKA